MAPCKPMTPFPKMHAISDGEWQEMLGEIDRLKTVVARLHKEKRGLRAALQEILDFPYVGAQASAKIWGIAKAALLSDG